ncbi:hypothetical protein OG949_22865 [Streptomyces scopuliridis]|uniref:hypothetical protein n=1 Tax=Streptomyces scopuliridis TaxID=452529 RepID=UPI002DD900C1|nr:hypothetical protein [Streptomyces scopuliridis]WSB35411.1 hypothetical protein OG949_22865 [Streptomyces scopuliridis]
MGGLTIGMVVYDRVYDMPGRVTGFAGQLVCLERPTGLAWASRWSSVRPATDWERRQLQAIAKLHAQRRLPARAQRHGPLRFAVCGSCHGHQLLRFLRRGKAVLIPCRSCRATGRRLVP